MLSLDVGMPLALGEQHIRRILIMRKLVRVLASVLFATAVASCAADTAGEDVDTVDTDTSTDTDTGGAGAGESFETEQDTGGDGGGSGGEGGDGSGSGGEGSGSGSGGEGSGSGSGELPPPPPPDTCHHDQDGSCDGGELPPPPPPPTCDHDHDGDCDGSDCDHDDDGDCDGGDGGGGHIEGACTFTQGYWKNHPDAWPVSSLPLGQVSYSSAQLGEILRTPIATDGLMILAHQLIAAKLNVAFGAPDASIADAIASADALIGNLVVGVYTLHPSVTSNLATELDTFNNSKLADEECN